MRISYSGLGTYQQCPLKYKFQAIDKIKEPKSKEQVFGTLIHSVMHFIHTPAILSPTLENALDLFSRNWNSDIFEDEQEERAAFSQGVKMIQNYYAKNNPADYNIIDLESRFAIEIGNEETGKHIVSGIIDRIDKTADGYEIIDYKTTKKMPSQEKVDNDLQLSIYLKAFLARYPKEIDHLDTITVSLYYLKHGVKLSSTRTREQLDMLEPAFLDVIAAIEAGKFDPIVSVLCDWCGYQKICPMWKHKFLRELTVEDDAAKRSIDELLTLRGQMASEKRRVAELQEILLRYMEQKNVERVFGDNGIAGKSIRKTFKYDEERLRSILEPLDQWEAVLKIDGIALRSILSVLPLPVKKEVEDTKVLDKESISISVKKGSFLEEDDTAE